MKGVCQNAFKKALDANGPIGILLVFMFSLIYLIETRSDYRLLLLSLIPLVALLILFFFKKLPQLVLWYVLLAIFMIDLLMKYFIVANHHFLLIYIILIIIIYYQNGRNHDFVANIKWIIIVVLIFAAIQKMLSPQFISGDFYYYMFNTGKFFKPILYFTPDMKDIIASNYLQIEELEQTNPNTLNTIMLQDIVPHLDVISRVFAWFTIIFELVTAIFFIWKPTYNITHLLFTILIIGIFVTRLENGFLTLLAIGGLWITDSVRYRTLYTVLAIGFMALIIINIGFH